MSILFCGWQANQTIPEYFLPLELSRIDAEQSSVPKAKPQTNRQEIVSIGEN